MLKALPAFLAGILLSCTLYANVIRVNSNLTTDATQKIYKTIQEAHNAATQGDTLMIEGSPVIYPGAIFTKRLVVFGPGYFLSENPMTQANASLAVIQGITIETTAKGSLLAGLLFAIGSSSYTVIVKADEVIIMRCNLSSAIQMPAQVNNVQIIQNYFNSHALSLGSTSYTFSGMIFKNNIVKGSLSAASATSYQRTFASIENNILEDDVDVTTANFRSNIISGTSVTVNAASVNTQNNLMSKTQLPLTNGNQTYNATNLFVGVTGNSQDGQYKIKPASPYLTAGYNNTQPGIFGGSQAYVLSGLPPIPSIYEFSADAFGSKQNGLPISIKVKANQ